MVVLYPLRLLKGSAEAGVEPAKRHFESLV